MGCSKHRPRGKISPMRTPPDLNKALGSRIRTAPIQCNLTQELLAEMSGISLKHVQRLEGKIPADAPSAPS